MTLADFDVVIVGAGAAGLTAAIGLARAGFRVAAVEAAPFPGAENWSGCVYFAENLAHPDILGPDGVEALAWERRLVERGFFATDGLGLLGGKYRDPDAFRHCYTVLRPIYDHHLAQIALQHGVALLSSTTAESLIRDDGRVVGICTNRGSIYGKLTFLAEGDASHLVAREGYERAAGADGPPKFLHGIKQVIELPPRAIEQRFGVMPKEGVAYEMLLKNGTLRGKAVHLNMGGFLYTNRQSLSIGLVLPADNLHEHFDGDPNLLVQWFLTLPSLRPWFADHTPGPFGAKLIRGGGARDIPTLIDDGLAIGGAASSIGIDFPYPNFTGPATAMGLLLVQAACKIREEDGSYTTGELERHYLGPLRKTHYWKDVEFLREWPGYVKKTRVFFDKNIDLALGSAHLWTRPGPGLAARWKTWRRLLEELAGDEERALLREDAMHFGAALRLGDAVSRPSPWRLLLDGALNTARDWTGTPRPLPAHGHMTFHYSVAGGAAPTGLPPAVVRRWFKRFAPALAAAARLVYSNDTTPLHRKLPAATRQLSRFVSLTDCARGLGLGLFAGAHWALGRFRRTAAATVPEETIAYFRAAQKAADLTPPTENAAVQWDARLAQLAYETDKTSHIHVLWPGDLADKNDVIKAGLWHVCPAHVYEARVSATGQVQVVVNFENCIKCETCWRTSGLVDWGRDGAHRFVYAVHSPVVPKLLADMDKAGKTRPALPYSRDTAPTSGGTGGLSASGFAGSENPRPTMGSRPLADKPPLAHKPPVAHKLEIKLLQFDAALAEEPRTVGRDRADYLLLLARYAQQLAKLVAESLPADDHWAFAIEALALRRVKHVEAQRYSWAAADGRQLRFHHLANLRRDEGAVAERRATPAATSRDLSHRLDDILPPAVWRDLEQQKPLTPQQDAELRRLLAEVPIVDVECLGETLCAPSRRYLLVELARRDPSLAYRAAHHLWARDVAVAFGGESLAAKAGCWRRAEEWACFAVVGDAGEALMVPAVSAKSVLGLVGSSAESLVCGGFAVRPIPTLGLRGAGLARVRFDPSAAAVAKQDVTGLGVVRFAEVLGSADLIAMALGMAEYLCQRANDHAGSRVQFPGLFHDEESRDTIGKFGAVKKMIAEMAAGRQLIEALALYLGAESEATSRAALLKAVVAEVLGTAPGSIAYDAGQVFGGTGYSEDDTLSKLYRDAAAWRFLAPANSKVYIAHGAALFENWTPDGAALSAVPGEEAAFAEIAQRLALTPELRQIREHTSALSQRVTAWKFADERLPTASAQAAFREAAARLDALLLASKIVLMQTHVALEAGTAGEVEILLLRVWLGKIQVDCDEFDSLVKCLLESEGAQVKVDGPPVTSYSEFLKADLPYSSGDFLNRPIDPAAPRYVPEMIETDDVLRERNRELIDLISGQFGAPREGKIYERYLEDRHRPDEADLDFLGQHGFFRMPIPKELGGEGRSKADYYLLVVNTHRLADAAISLTVQVNSSLGSTPVLVPREKELPKARKDLAAFVQDAALHAEIAGMLEDLAKKVAPAADVLAAIQKKLDDKVLSQPVLRVACNHFVTVWQKAGRAGTQTTLSDALTAWREACGGAGEFLDELARRSEAYDLFCRWVASGQISAFALTEPSAGSDTARVATRARLRQVTVVAVPDGVYTFVPAGGKAPRRLIDGRRVVFERHANKAGGAEELLPFYRFAEAAAPAPICFDEYDYQTDACKKRYFLVDGRREYFDDVAQLREREGRLWYDYYELTGAKMWITNGRCMGIMALYAKTDEGVTGFIVDRHAEGLIVGKDEAKMGQNGSPTNELALQAVRVPRENVIGLEGRGQVNALETLNVGRAGLAMSAMCQMVRLCDWSREFARRVFGEIPAWIAWRLERLEEERFIAEAMAYEIIGRFEHKQTKSIRMESAIAKMLVSELFHHSIEIAEEVHGLAGQTQEHLVEKRKRDARILNIYEGTNEIQRFLILRELSECIVDQPAPVSGHAVDAFKHRLRQLVREAVQAFGQQLWQNPNFQANCFLLSEVAAWLTAAESTLGRFVWLTRQGTCSTEKMATGRRALMRCRQEAETRLARFATELTQLRDGRYAPAIRAATLLMQATHDSAAMTASRIDKSLSILVVLDPPMPGAPRPRVHDGKLQEAYRVFTHADRAALETALRLKEAAPELVHLQAATVGPAATAVQLREMLSLGFDRVMLVVTDEAVAPDRAAAALASARAGFADANGQQHAGPAFDLVLGGAGLADTQEGLLARLTGEVLGVPSAGSAQGIALDNGLRLIGSDGHERVRALPAAVSVEPGTALRPFTTAGWLAGLEKEVEILPLPTVLSVSPLEWEEAALAAANVSGEEAPRPLLPREATRLVLETAGIVSSSTANGSASRTDAEPPVAVDVDVPGFAAKGAIPSIVAILATDADGKLRPTARKTLEACQFVAPFIDGAPRAVLLLVPAGDACQRALTEIAALTSFDICLLTVPESAASDEVRCRLLVECWSNLETIPLAVIAEPWAESALASLATAAGSVEPIALRVRLLDRHKGRLAAEGAAVRGKLRTRQTLSSAPGHTVWIGLAADADVGAATPPAARPSRSVERWAPRLDRFFGRGDMRRLLEELKQGAGLTRLADAEFIVDVGFGVANRDGYEAVIQPLEHALRHLGVKNLMVGGSRKVTEELHLLPADRQIGQSGVSVQPRVLLAIGVSGAPQHLNYIGPRTTIVAFNRDPEAPLMTLNQRQARPRVYPVIGDLFETVPAFIACLG